MQVLLQGTVGPAAGLGPEGRAAAPGRHHEDSSQGNMNYSILYYTDLVVVQLRTYWSIQAACL